MNDDRATADTRRNPLSTWCALGGVVLLLSGLSFVLIGCFTKPDPPQAKPNYYTCRVTCTSGFGIGATIDYIDGGAVNSSPGGAFVGQEAAGSTGTIIAGPGSPQGSSEVWWQIQFADNLQGWVAEAKLQVTGGTGVVEQQKDLDVCVPVQWNPNRPEYDPSVVQDVNQDCTDRVVSVFKQAHKDTLMPGTGCTGQAITNVTKEDDSCNADCHDSSGVCVRMGWDPDPPAPDPISTAVFATSSVCEVAGTANLVVAGHTPKKQPGVRGTLQILGRPCPGGFCKVGVAYAFTADDIEFDSGSIFASDPKFVDISVVGSTAPDDIDFGPFLGCTDCSLGALTPGTAFTTAQGRRSGSSTASKASFRNTEAVAVAVNWEQKTCRFSGNLGGQVLDDDGSTLDVTADVALDGVLVNQPPHPDTSKTAKTVECTDPNATTVTLDGSRSTDPDNNIAFYVWRKGSDTGAHVGNPSTNPVVTTKQAVGATTYDLRVVDRRFAADHTQVTVTVVDKTAPAISCNAPAAITPFDVAPQTTSPGVVPQNPQQGVSFKATATDMCSGVAQISVSNAACSRSNTCRVTSSGDTVTILNSGGAGNTISWTVAATDGTGNQTTQTCQVNVINK